MNIRTASAPTRLLAADERHLAQHQAEFIHPPPTVPHVQTSWKVVVGNLSRETSDVHLHSLFRNIGHVHSTALFYPALPTPTGFAEVAFGSKDEARNATALSGWNVCGSPITITQAEPIVESSPTCSLPRSPSVTSGSSSSSMDPEKRNLYVLNLPLDITNEELIRLFQPYGHVSHACILAILDSCARRRGFILMGSGEEATRAMKGLHGKVIRDYCLDVSYSVVQKTGHAGYRSSEDDTTRQNRSLSRARPPPHHYESLRQLSSTLPHSFKMYGSETNSSNDILPLKGLSQPDKPLAEGHVPILVVENLDPGIFATSDDLTSIFSFFGEFVSAELFSTSSSTPNAAVVQFRHRADAEAACKALDRQHYSDKEIRVKLLDSHAQPLLERTTSAPFGPSSAPARGLSQSIHAPTYRQPSHGLPSPSSSSKIGCLDEAFSFPSRPSLRSNTPTNSHTSPPPLPPCLAALPTLAASKSSSSCSSSSSSSSSSTSSFQTDFDPFAFKLGVSPTISPTRPDAPFPGRLHLPPRRLGSSFPSHSFSDTLTPARHYMTSSTSSLPFPPPLDESSERTPRAAFAPDGRDEDTLGCYGARPIAFFAADSLKSADSRLGLGLRSSTRSTGCGIADRMNSLELEVGPKLCRSGASGSVSSGSSS